MKKRFFATLMGTLIGATLILGGCGSSAKTADEAPLPEIEVAGVAETPAPEAETDSASTETVKEETLEEVVEESPEEAPEATAEEPKEEVKETTEEAEVAEATEVEIVKDVPTEVQAAEPQATEVSYATVIDKYIADGVFSEEDHVAYGAEMGAESTDDYPNHWDIHLNYTSSDYYVAVGTNAQDATYAYVGIADWKSGNGITYCCLYDYTKSTDNVSVYSDGVFVPRQLLYDFETTINYMKSNPDAHQKPSIPGMTWIGWDEW
ncbi:MAG: hypothetical protein Q4E70_00555 [Candidatus Saccharibacteria bacterium]|nr:hypothetical protein [Candidatus Saccharibacteria bacterium]